MRAGVTMIAPDATYVDADVGPIGKDVWLAAGVCLRGKTKVGDGAVIDTGCVLKFSEAGEILQTLWDLGGQNHPMITSMREHRGHLYLGGISNNRIGRYKLEGADPDFVQYEKRWGRMK